MARGAVDSLSNMRSVIESNVRLLDPTPDSLPWNVLPLVVVGFQFFDLRTLRHERRVTVPTRANVGNGSLRAAFDRYVAVHTGELNLADVNIVRERDGLLCVGSISEKV